MPEFTGSDEVNVVVKKCIVFPLGALKESKPPRWLRMAMSRKVIGVGWTCGPVCLRASTNTELSGHTSIGHINLSKSTYLTEGKNPAIVNVELVLLKISLNHKP